MAVKGWSRSDIGARFLLLGVLAVTGCAANVATPPATEEVASQVELAEPAEEATVAASEVPAVEAELVVETSVAEPAPAYFVDGNGLAIRGTDPVAYFTEGAPVTGRAEFTYTWGNATWRFASAENRDLFIANPVQYAPQYGGFCAWAVSQGYTAAIDPNAWRIVDGRLYLNFSPGVQRQWEQDIPGHISRADANWPGVL